MDKEIEMMPNPPTDGVIDRIPVEVRMGSRLFPDAMEKANAEELMGSAEALTRPQSGDSNTPIVVAGIQESSAEQVGPGLDTPAKEHRTQRETGEIDRVERKIKLSLEVTPELNRVIEHIADATGATKSEAIRKAIVLMEVAIEAKEKGERLYVGTQPPPGASREIIGL